MKLEPIQLAFWLLIVISNLQVPAFQALYPFLIAALFLFSRKSLRVLCLSIQWPPQSLSQRISQILSASAFQALQALEVSLIVLQDDLEGSLEGIGFLNNVELREHQHRN